MFLHCPEYTNFFFLCFPAPYHYLLYISHFSPGILYKLMFVFYLLQCLGSPVLGYLAAGVLIGPYGLSIIRHVHGTKAIAEFGVVFLLFNIGLEVEFIV